MPLLVLVLMLCGFVRPAGAASLPQDIRLPITQHTLRNGMQFLIVERRDSPTFSAYLRFKVGSASEPSGQTGLAHLLEHMMFKGTRIFGTTDPDREIPILERIDRRYAVLQAERA